MTTKHHTFSRRLAAIAWSAITLSALLAALAAAAACLLLAQRVHQAQEMRDTRWVTMLLVERIKADAMLAPRARLAQLLQSLGGPKPADDVARIAVLKRLEAAGFVVGWRPRSQLEAGAAGPALPSGRSLDGAFFRALGEAPDFLAAEGRLYLRLPDPEHRELARAMGYTHSSRVVIGVPVDHAQLQRVAQRTQPPGTEFTFYLSRIALVRLTHERGEPATLDTSARPLPQRVEEGLAASYDLENPLDLPGLMLHGADALDSAVRVLETRHGAEREVLYVQRAFGPREWSGYSLAWLDDPAPPNPWTAGRVLGALALVVALFAALAWWTARSLRAAASRC